ncbi:hypothetical protein L1275_003048 [Flavobacterium sp. HSC-61S13]|nr:hypothetical protein [Flavobacterium sp. HSC-61S13]
MKEIYKNLISPKWFALWKKKYTAVLVMNFLYILFFYFLMQLYS